MQIKHFETGGFVAHRYMVPGSSCYFSVWFNRDGFAIDAERIDSMRRSYPVTAKQWGYIQRHKIAGLMTESEIMTHKSKGLTQ